MSKGRISLYIYILIYIHIGKTCNINVLQIYINQIKTENSPLEPVSPLAPDDKTTTLNFINVLIEGKHDFKTTFYQQ